MTDNTIGKWEAKLAFFALGLLLLIGSGLMTFTQKNLTLAHGIIGIVVALILFGEVGIKFGTDWSDLKHFRWIESLTAISGLLVLVLSISAIYAVTISGGALPIAFLASGSGVITAFGAFMVMVQALV